MLRTTFLCLYVYMYTYIYIVCSMYMKLYPIYTVYCLDMYTGAEHDCFWKGTTLPVA
jgi:hypothetical protein